MKFYETHFEEYIESSKKENLHPKLEKIYKQFPKQLKDLKNIIFYGPKGTGKYTQVLRSIKQYSPTGLKYEKKLSITFNKQQYFFKISDIHCEVDMSLLGCNSKLLWNEIFQQIIDIISAKVDKCGIIVCKYFHDIHSELLDNFYNYMQENNTMNSIHLKYIIISEHISFIPESILNCSEIIHVSRPTKARYLNCSKNKSSINIDVDKITNIKNLYSSNSCMHEHIIICDKIINMIININELKYLKCRDTLYDILIYNLDITDCIWYILFEFIKTKRISNEDMPETIIKTYQFLKYFNNNYRPIYHLENYIFYLIQIVHNMAPTTSKK
jgi:Cdc6-like AAA superfamily ATPase